MGGLLYAIMIVVGFYLMLMAICWWIEYNNLAMGIPMFRYVTFGIGNAQSMNLKKYLTITIIIYVGMLTIITGTLQKIVVAIFIFIFKLPGFFMGLGSK